MSHVTIPVKWLNELLDLCGPEDHELRERVMKSAAPAAPAEVELMQALSDLVNALRERHYGRMPEEVQAAYDKAWAIVFAGPSTTAAPAAPAVDALGERDAAFEAVRKRLCGLQRYSFVLDDDGVVRRAQDRTGNWIEFDDAHALFDPVAVDAARAAQAKEGGEA